MSYDKAGSTLVGANDEKLTEFATDEYKGWKLSSENRAAILAGTLTPEAAIRDSYEPALQIGYDGPNAPSLAYAIGLEAGDAAQVLNQIAATKPKTQ